MNGRIKTSRTPIVTAAYGYLIVDKSGNRRVSDREAHRVTESMRGWLLIRVESFT